MSDFFNNDILVKEIKELDAQQRDLDRRKARLLEEAKDKCPHRIVYRCDGIGNDGGYMFMCVDCFVEEHEWSPRVLRTEYIVKIPYLEFLRKRPFGEGHSVRNR